MQTIEQLTTRFGIEDEVWFEELADGYPVIRVGNKHATASVTLHGAHLTDYVPAGKEPVIFTSKAAVFREGKAIRGGIPICWPWFGAHPEKSPSHGYARISFWTLEKTESSEEGTRLVFSLPPQELSGLTAMVEFHIGKDLQLALHTHNLGIKPQTFSEALHSYFWVTDSRQTRLHGLDGASFISTVGEESVHRQVGAVEFPDEVDRIYQSTSEVIIEDLVSQRRVRVDKANSSNTVVWNPGQEKGSAMGDLDAEEITRFVCAESANVREQSITLPSGGSHILHLKISTES